ncbi:hypothetical protein BC827DRAFT_824697 [Russula dissimulans]|nr:hypothetical protein BC827DRAFT_824697 [Russula dissimulans]
MRAFLNFPPELFYQIALHLPLTRDILALGLTNSRVHDALSTSALFKARLALQGWDVSAWKNKDDDAAQPLIKLKRWMRIDHIYCKTTQLFEENAQCDPVLFSVEDIEVDGLAEWGQGWPKLVALSDLELARSDGIRILDGEKTFSWLRKLSDVLPMFVTHLRGGNISRITEDRHYNALWAYTTFVDGVCFFLSSICRQRRPPVNPPEYGCFERICFSLIALLIQCGSSLLLPLVRRRFIWSPC